jgi:aryl sulfotransferase
MEMLFPATREVRSWTTDSRRWCRYSPRPGDIVIGTPAKTGTTWTQQIVTLLISQSPELRPVMDIAPWLDFRLNPLDEIMERIDALPSPRVIKTHLSFDAMPVYDGVRYIHVGRDGRDVLMSWHNHCSAYTDEVLARLDAAGAEDETIGRSHPRAEADIHAFYERWIDESNALRDDFSATRFFDIEKSYWRERHLPNLLIVHYSDLKTDLAGEMKRIAAFLDLTVRESVWPALVEAATFEFMKKNGAALLPNAVHAWDGGYQRFLFKGTNSRWCGVLSEGEVAQYRARASRALTPGLGRWLEHGRLSTGEPREMPD